MQSLLPGILYYGNLSRAKSGRVAVATGALGEESQYEEHRYPMPFAPLELKRGDANGTLARAFRKPSGPVVVAGRGVAAGRA